MKPFQVVRAVTLNDGSALSMAVRAESVPALLREHPRWLLWTKDGSGKKAPRSFAKPDRNVDGTKASNWATFAKATEAATRHAMGVGFALGTVQDGPTFAGVDLDKCRNPETGVLDAWAQRIVGYLNSYTEVSPSGTGVKVFLLGTLPDGAKQGKVFKLELYARDRYFTVTGQHLPGTPTTVEDRTDQLRDLHEKTWTADLLTLVRVFGYLKRDAGETIDIECPWAAHHSTPDQPRDAGLRRTNGLINGFHCFHAGCSERTLADVKAFFGLAGRNGDFVEDARHRIIPDNQENVLRALAGLHVDLAFNRFDDRIVVRGTERGDTLTTPVAKHLWLLIDRTYRFRPTLSFLEAVCEERAHTTPFHPVVDYLAGLTWDQTPRLDRWLTAYGGAADTAMHRAVAAIVLIAAVRRVRQPGCKFDELLVLISGRQGTDKSSALQALCPQDPWFSDDLPLNVDAKQIVERTSGKWIIEAAELNGFGKRDVEHLKAMLSRQVDGPVRLAYDRLPTEKPRQFIIVGTTNTHQFLKDKTGNRRFWPVEVSQFDAAAIRRDRDQLWAEAATREAAGESIRLDPSLWSAAAKAQAARQVDDPWLPELREFLGLDGEPDGPDFLPGQPRQRDRIALKEVWGTLGIPVDRRTDQHMDRLNGLMQSLGYVKKRAKGLGDERKRTAHRWCLADATDSGDDDET